IIGESFLDGIFQDAKESLAEFIAYLETEEAQQKAEELGEKVRVAFNKLTNAVKGVISWYRGLDDWQQSLILKVGAFAVAIGPVLLGLGTLGNVISKVSTGLGVFFGWLAPIMTPLKGVAEGAGKAGKNVGLFGRLLTGLTSPIGIAISIITLLATGFTIAYKKSETFRNIIQSLGEKLRGVFSGIAEWMKPAKEAVFEFFKGVKEKITAFKNEEAQGVIEAFQNIWEFVNPILTWIADKVKWAFDTVIKPIIGVVMKAVELLIKTVWGNIKGIITGALDVIMGAVKVCSGLLTRSEESRV